MLGSLRTLNTDFGIPILYITHDLTTAYHVANAIIVLYRGEVVEAGDAEAVIQQPQHPYTRLLVDSIPWPDLETPWGNGRPLVDGFATPAPASAVGCAFAARCPHAMPRCRAAAVRRSSRPTRTRPCAACCTRTHRASRKRD